jgi:diamine N-acetyltransferase
MAKENDIAIRQISRGEDLEVFAAILRRSFGTVADEFGLTEENCPTNPAFIRKESLDKQSRKKITFYLLYVSGQAVGSIAIEQSPEKDTVYFIERIAVIPELRHMGYGKMLMEFAFDCIRQWGGSEISIAIMDENIRLKKWYKCLGFEETIIREFSQLPFKVCFMHKLLG